jgi:hypothetical protein
MFSKSFLLSSLNFIGQLEAAKLAFLTGNYGTSAYSNGFGTSMNTAANVNFNGHTDFAITQPNKTSSSLTTNNNVNLVHTSNNNINSGTASYVVNTSNTKPSSNPNEIQNTINVNVFNGTNSTNPNVSGQTSQQTHTQLSYHPVAGLGTIDGSGKNYFAVEASGSTNTTNINTGAIYILPDLNANITLPIITNNGWTNLDGLVNTGGFVISSSTLTFNTANTNESQIRSAGDINADGIKDLLINAPLAHNGQGSTILVFGQSGGLTGQKEGVVNLDALLADGLTKPFGTPGTAVEYVGSHQASVGLDPASLGIDITGGISVTGPGSNTVSPSNEPSTSNSVTTILTQPSSNADNQVYYQGTDVTVQGGLSPITAGAHIVTGSGNNDWVHGIGTNSQDSVVGGIGNDCVGITGSSFASVNGGGGNNTLEFEGNNIVLNLSTQGTKVQGFSLFDLNNQLNTQATDPQKLFLGKTAGNLLCLDASDVIDMGSTSSTSNCTLHTVTVLGDSTSSVNLLDSGWVQASGGQTGSINGSTITFDKYVCGNNTSAQLLIEHGVHVNLI